MPAEAPVMRTRPTSWPSMRSGSSLIFVRVMVAPQSGKSGGGCPGLRRSSALLLLFLVELLLRKLADRCLRQLRAEVERLHHLVFAELVLQERLQLGERKRLGAGLQPDERLRR